MYLKCPICSEFIRMPDITKDCDLFEKIKCHNCSKYLMYKDNGSVLVSCIDILVKNGVSFNIGCSPRIYKVIDNILYFKNSFGGFGLASIEIKDLDCLMWQIKISNEVKKCQE